MSALPSWLEDPSEPSDGAGRPPDVVPARDGPSRGRSPDRLRAGADQPASAASGLRLGLVSVFVFCLLLAATIGAFLIFKQKVRTDERNALEERAAQTALLFESFTDEIERALVGGAIVTAATSADEDAFEQAFNESINDALLTTAAILEVLDDGSYVEITSAADAAVLPVMSDAGRERIREASVNGGVQLVDVATVGGAKVIGLAAAPQGGSSSIAYAELIVPDVVAAAGSVADDQVHFAFYLAERETEDALIAANTAELPIGAPRVVNRLHLGQDEPLIVVGARGSLIGPLAALSPWIALAIGLIAAVILSALVEITRRSRDDALQLVDNLKLTNADLDRSERRFRGLFDSANDIVFTARADGTILSMNPAGEHVTGYGRHELLGMNFGQLLASNDRSETVGTLEELISDGNASVREIELLTRDGERAALELSTQLVEVDGRTEAVQGIGRDVRERKRLQQQLLQAQKMEAIGQLAGGVAHDFNNVLTAILASSEMLLLDMPSEDPLRDEAVEIKKATDRASRLTQQLLAFSRRQELQPEPLELNEIVVDLEHMLSRLIGKSIDLTLDLDHHLGMVTADPGQIEQVIVNLVVNAGHAMPDGGTVTISTRNCDRIDPSLLGGDAAASGPYVLLAVRDTGHGMDEATRERIFEPFFTTKEKGRGTGLGLATVHGIVTQSGGHLSVESELGEGTTFSIHLPRAATG